MSTSSVPGCTRTYRCWPGASHLGSERSSAQQDEPAMRQDDSIADLSMAIVER